MQKIGYDQFKIYRFEDLFYNKDKTNSFMDMLNQMTDFDNNYNYEYKPNLMSNKVHSNKKKKSIPEWVNWDNNKAQILNQHCKRWMEKYNYGNEKEWNKKIS